MDEEGRDRAAARPSGPRRADRRATHPDREAEFVGQRQQGRQQQQQRGLVACRGQVEVRLGDNDGDGNLRVRAAPRPGLGVSPRRPHDRPGKLLSVVTRLGPYRVAASAVFEGSSARSILISVQGFPKISSARLISRGKSGGFHP